MDQVLNFKDLFKSSFQKTMILNQLNISEIILGLVITLVLSLVLFYIYKKTYSGIAYNHNYNVTLVLMALITSMVIMTISSNLILSLGMVGALSIIRFRTAIKDPLDTAYMFWAIGIGLTVGAKMYLITIVSSICIAVCLVFLLKYKNQNNVFMLVVHYEEDAEYNVLNRLSKITYKLKSKTLSYGKCELTIELKLLDNDTEFIGDLSEIDGVETASLITYNGNFVA